jgi:hypothetical protein
LKYCRSARNFAPITENPQNITDRAWYGKGHSFSTFVDRLTHSYVIPAQERSASVLETLYAAACCMGKDTVTGASAPYTHTVTFNPTSTVKEVQYTTLGEVFGAEEKYVASGAWINAFTLTGNRADHVVLSYEGGARKLAGGGTFTAPAISATSFYKTLYGTLKFGASGGSVFISPDVLSWTITISQNAQPMFLMGNSAGEEMLLSKVLIGKQSVNGNFVLFMDKDYRAYFGNDTECELEINAISPDLVGAGPSHESLKITIPEVKIVSEAFGLEGDSIASTMNMGEEGVLKTGVGEPITLAFNTAVDDTEILVAAQ